MFQILLEVIPDSQIDNVSSLVHLMARLLGIELSRGTMIAANLMEYVTLVRIFILTVKPGVLNDVVSKIGYLILADHEMIMKSRICIRCISP